MAIARIDRVVQTAQGQAISGALVYFLQQPASLSTLTPLAPVYSSAAGVPAANPQVTDGLGQVGCYLDNSQAYTVVVVSPLIQTQVYPDQVVGGLGTGGSSSAPQPQIPAGAINGVNTAFTLASTGSLVLVIYNGRVLKSGLGYTLVGLNLTLANAPQAGDSLEVLVFA